MTKANLKEMYKGWSQEICKNYFEDTTLEELKELCKEYGDGHKWCSWDKCLEEIIKGGNQRAITRAFMIYERYMTNRIRMKEYEKIAIATKNFNI